MLFRGGLKLKERLVMGISVVAVLFTLLLVVDIQMDLGISGRHLVASHGRIRYAVPQEGAAVYDSFKNRLLQKTHSNNISKESLPNADASGAKEQSQQQSKTQKDKEDKQEEMAVPGGSGEKDDFSDIVDYIMLTSSERVKYREGVGRVHPVIKNKVYSGKNPTLGQLKGLKLRKNSTLLEHFHYQISQNELYPVGSSLIDAVLHEMITEPITHVAQKTGGTQLKLIIDYENGMQALFKPMRFPREQQTLPNHFYFTDYERHNAEIAAFHLDRLLGFRRAMPVTGRILNMTTELYQKADGDLLYTFFISPSDNMCFHGKCSYYCDTSHAICGHPDTLEGSFAAFLPPSKIAPTKIRAPCP
ncbi:unnamed protein product [Acanthoscelides obtectus]|uniref:FAM20 C-terminal domain-containing protein n=1 Tax=Acanthoscelides obtectus TaxID=200917 RepID=A0A9P0M4T0_ACAOB|nr:unnamed protein product [Acanthoscelides obtectus]CAK1668384.1 Extracellular serine/threonine protein CG31145 [Acanthoscelides obtectus]